MSEIGRFLGITPTGLEVVAYHDRPGSAERLARYLFASWLGLGPRKLRIRAGAFGLYSHGGGWVCRTAEHRKRAPSCRMVCHGWRGVVADVIRQQQSAKG